MGADRGTDPKRLRRGLSGDLEKLRSFYMDRGYADFRVESTQVAISPDRKAVNRSGAVKGRY